MSVIIWNASERRYGLQRVACCDAAIEGISTSAHSRTMSIFGISTVAFGCHQDMMHDCRMCI